MIILQFWEQNSLIKFAHVKKNTASCSHYTDKYVA